MRRNMIRILSGLLVIGLLLACPVSAVFAEAEQEPVITHVPTYENTHVNTGNQMLDIFEIAKTQMGYVEGTNNDTKYGLWYGQPNSAWCCLFVVWCARQAGVSTDKIPQTAAIWRLIDALPDYIPGTEYTPKPGDLFMTSTKGHVGYVYQVEGDYFRSLEGNTNPDRSQVGYGAMSNRRQISEYLFIPMSYEGGGNHNYVRGYDTDHPHKVYYECSDCGDKYYNGSTAVVDDCGKCISGYSHENAGYYLCTSPDNMTYLRSSPSYDAGRNGGVPSGEVVYVYGIKGNWAYVEFQNLRGYVHMSNFTRYADKPQTPLLQGMSSEYRVSDQVSFSWNPVENNENFRLQLFRDGTLVRDLDLGTDTSYTLTDAKTGQYEVRLSAANKTGSSAPAVHTFAVRDVFYVSYDGVGGSPVPETQEKVLGKTLRLATQIPAREGYTFLGWAEEQGGTHGAYQPGADFDLDRDIKLYAVWKDNASVPQSLSVAQLPKRTRFMLDEPLDTAGLTLKITYSDGTSRNLTEGFRLEGYASDSLGTKTVTAWAEGLSVSFEVEVLAYIPGDVNNDWFVNRDDVMYLLWYINFPEDYPVSIPVDYTGDGNVNRDDVMHLLWHINFPEDYPLTVS